MNIIFVGASITQGYWDNEGGWVARIAKKYMSQAVAAGGNLSESKSVFNLGVSGDFADRILKRLDIELAARAEREDAVVFSFGTNDSQRRDGKFISSPKKFRDDLAKVSKIAKKYVNKVIFLNILPCDDKRVQPVAWRDSIYYYNDRINEFNTVLKDYVVAVGGQMIDVNAPFVTALAKQDLLYDGLHPNTAGHELITDIVMTKLEEILR